ncbi:uncharacterized protein K444DRAFT_621398 [Hyaloscypha bicolor E]|uniref:Uncharacterized protein n=1 Tax=Hyaloscypha bicolor E TaxID=1095630 RepID=A0A2J6SNC7_9HELO|nr:uncharacterized protein K444DRAFT_621398 [Hyaloscypha bicolor E]PMD52265.1 hypothetical protein K444DRAFT_621398 [Hyaloscypha bicolor E]
MAFPSKPNHHICIISDSTSSLFTTHPSLAKPIHILPAPKSSPHSLNWHLYDHQTSHSAFQIPMET